jgi:hypothetical protein
MTARPISAEDLAEVCARIERGEKPEKTNEISSKDFIGRMLPHVKAFLEQGYTYREIAEFLGHVSAGALRKAVAKDAGRAEKKTKQEGKAARADQPEKPEQAENTAALRVRGRGRRAAPRAAQA